MKNFSVFWLLIGPLAVCLFWAAVGITALSVLRKRNYFLLHGVSLMAGTYFIIQCISYYVEPITVAAWPLEAAARFVGLPRPLHLLLFAGISVVTWQLYDNLIRYGKTRITPMSVKEAVDSLPSGICFYRPGGRIMMINRAMEELCGKALGRLPLSGEVIREGLFSGRLEAGWSLAAEGERILIIAPDQTVWSFSERMAQLSGKPALGLIATDVTELYQKTLMLRERKEKLAALNERLTVYNREIVSLTAEKERLSAKVRLHDETGADLLAIKNYLQNGGGETEREEIRARLRRNVSFLLTGDIPAAGDEYELMLKTAGELGVRVHIEGRLPQEEPQKHVAATAIHECLTNTLRHAHGDELRVKVEENSKCYILSYTNNGEQPAEPVWAKGGLKSLRTLARNTGGSMEISISPVFTVRLILPKEVPHACQRIDRG